MQREKASEVEAYNDCMDKWSKREYRGGEDLRAVLALAAARPAERVSDYPGLLDLEELLALEAVQRHTRLWEVGERLAAYAFVDEGSLAFETAPEAPAEVAAAVLAWAEGTAAAEGWDELSTSARAENPVRAALLEANGYAAEPVRTLHFMRRLGDEVEEPTLPEGFVIRPLGGEGEVEALVALHRAAHDTEYMTVELRLAMMHTPGYDPAVDLVAAAPNGDLAAYAVCRVDERENALRGIRVGYTDPVATHPAYQRRGLAKALLLAGFRYLQKRGMEWAELGTYGENTGMIRAALSAGFTVCGETVFYTRRIQRMQG